MKEIERIIGEVEIQEPTHLTDVVKVIKLKHSNQNIIKPLAKEILTWLKDEIVPEEKEVSKLFPGEIYVNSRNIGFNEARSTMLKRLEGNYD